MQIDRTLHVFTEYCLGLNDYIISTTIMMKKSFLIFLSVFLLTAQGQALELYSTDIYQGAALDNAYVYDNYGCHGDNLSPQLNWYGAPYKTKSFAITVYDPDAPAPGGWWHWIIFNLPSGMTNLPRGIKKFPAGTVESITSFKMTGYNGACPPRGPTPHRYEFTLYALDTPKLDLDEDDSIDKVLAAIKQHTLDQATITPVYRRP